MERVMQTLAAMAIPGMIFAFLFGATIGPNPAQATPTIGVYEEVIEIPGGGTVRLSCDGSTLIAVSDVFDNQFGMTGGDVALARDPSACRSDERARMVADRSRNGQVTAFLYRKGNTFIAFTPIRTNQFGVTGGSVALTSIR